jgi:nucleoid-associated protein YgaU
VRADRQALAEIKRWQANWPEPDGHAEELVLQARACAIERRNLRKLHDALAELDRSLDTWEAIRQRRADERLHRLGQIIPWIQDEETEPKAVAELTSWRDELRRQTDDTAPPAKPDADPRAELKRLRAELAKLLTASARACDGVETDVGKGRTETLVHTAGLYPQERQRREQVQTDMENFLAQLTVWLGSAGSTPGADLRRVERILRLATAEEPTATVAPAAKPVTDVTAPADPESFEYYQLPKDQTLKEISALPTIYGDPAKWNRLLEANREAVPSPEAALPSGTLLVIPRTPQTKPATN